MNLVKVECPSCNSTLDLEEGQKKITCKYCGSVLLVDDGTVKVDHVFYDGDKISKYKNAETALKLGNYEKAFVLYSALSQEYSYDPEVWYNLLRSKTKMFNVSENINSDEYDSVSTYNVLVKKYNEIFDTYSKLEKDSKLLSERSVEFYDFLNELEEKYNSQIDLNKESKKVNEKSLNNFSLLLVPILLTIVVICILLIIILK